MAQTTASGWYNTLLKPSETQDCINVSTETHFEMNFKECGPDDLQYLPDRQFT